MPNSAIIFLGVMLLIFAALDFIMLFSLLYPGDERNQIIVWKASAFTLLAIAGSTLLDVIVCFVQAQRLEMNPLVQLEVMAIIYFASLLYYRARHSG
ncbi:MAG: hypothetical protein ACOX7F_03400 [Eubacteriales bacterium]|jgi:hypothetical protein